MAAERRPRAVFLDRDGVLTRLVFRNGGWTSPMTLEEFAIYPEAHAALASLRHAGYRLVVVTNQPDVARGMLPRACLEAMHDRLRAALPLDDIRACYHDDGECQCRKPLPGMLLADPTIDTTRSFMVGDRWRDIEAGRNAGCTTVLIDRGYPDADRSRPDVVVKSVAEAAAWIRVWQTRSRRLQPPLYRYQ